MLLCRRNGYGYTILYGKNVSNKFTRCHVMRNVFRRFEESSSSKISRSFRIWVKNRRYLENRSSQSIFMWNFDSVHTWYILERIFSTVIWIQDFSAIFSAIYGSCYLENGAALLSEFSNSYTYYVRNEVCPEFKRIEVFVDFREFPLVSGSLVIIKNLRYLENRLS